MHMNISSDVKKTIVITAVVMIVIIIISAVSTHLFTPIKHIKVKSTPGSVSVKVNNKVTALKDGELRLEKGHYTLLFSADNYNNHIRELVVGDDLSDTTLVVALDPLSPGIFKDSAENQSIIEEADKQTGGLLSFKRNTIQTTSTTATLSPCRSLRYANATAVCVVSLKPIVDSSLEEQLKNDFNRSLTLYEIYYGYNYMASVYKKEDLIINYADTITGETKPMLYVKTSLRDINEIYSRIELAGINKENVYLNFEDSELTRYSSIRQGGPEPQHSGYQ